MVLLCACEAVCRAQDVADTSSAIKNLRPEKLSGEGIWIMPARRQQARVPLRVTVWFEDQFLGDGQSYQRRAKTFANWKRRELRSAVVATLKALSDKSYATAKESLDALAKAEAISNLERHWIVNGISCNVRSDKVDELTKVPGVRKIFRARNSVVPRATVANAKSVPAVQRAEFSPSKYLHPWYTRSLLADRVWSEFRVTGKGTLNIISDFNFVLSECFTYNLYRNANEVPDNGKDDDRNGLVDDYHGYNFAANSSRLTTRPVPGNAFNGQLLHGSMCAAIICGAGRPSTKHEFGLAPEGRWAGVIAGPRLEAAVEWAIEQEADTYSMSFSIPDLDDYRSHWRKVMEHGSFCGVYFVSGAGNFAQSARVPVQMRVPEDIPNVVFAAAGVQRNLSRTPFSSKGPVEWNTEHYKDGRVQKPEVCAFNMGLPLMAPNGQVRPTGMNGNSFAGPMFCGVISLMVSADPDLLPWDLKEIITSTSLDVASEGIDDETGHGLINCYRAVKEVLRRKAVREGKDASKYEGRQVGDELDVKALRKRLTPRFTVARVQPGSSAAKKGVRIGDVIVKCAGKPISNMQQFRAAKAQATSAKAESITVEFERDGKSIPIDFVPGNWGMAAGPSYGEPVFR
jgi:hypothetical protein